MSIGHSYRDGHSRVLASYGTRRTHPRPPMLVSECLSVEYGWCGLVCSAKHVVLSSVVPTGIDATRGN
eukprot:1699123-Prymnesium_polylepis.1